MKRTVRAAARALRLAYVLVLAEIGSREIAILFIAAGVYLIAAATWAPIATGAALVVAGGLVLWAATRGPAEPREGKRP